MASNTLNDASQDAKEQIAQLRDQVQSLMSERVTPALASAADTAQKYMGQAKEYVGQAQDIYTDQSEALSERVREFPIVAIMIAAGVGYLLGRIAR